MGCSEVVNYIHSQVIYNLIAGIPGMKEDVCLLINSYHISWLVVHFYLYKTNARIF